MVSIGGGIIQDITGYAADDYKLIKTNDKMITDINNALADMSVYLRERF